MPLRAQLGDEWVNAALLCDAEWQSLKGTRFLWMPCCGKPAYSRTSRFGTRHFVHSPASHCGAEKESAEHLAATAEIVQVCHELGWDVVSEFAGETWRADVYARRGRVAFEVQWSPQTLEVTRERHAAYGTDVKCCWLFKKLPLINGRPWRGDELELPAVEQDLPLFQLSFSDSGFKVRLIAPRWACAISLKAA